MTDRLAGCFKQVVVMQLGLLLMTFIVASLAFSIWHGLATALGGGLAILNTVLARRSIIRASKLAYTQPDVGMLPVFSGLLQRIFVFAAGFAGGVMLLGLPPLPVIAGFVLVQLGYLACKMS